MQYCSNCGKENSDLSNFCKSCGQSIGNVDEIKIQIKSVNKKQTNNPLAPIIIIGVLTTVIVISCLATIGIGGFSSAQKKARDGQRRSDVKIYRQP